MEFGGKSRAFRSALREGNRFDPTASNRPVLTFEAVHKAYRADCPVLRGLNLEIARNLYWSFTLYENYDTKPPVNANKNDFGVTNSIGWKF